MRTSTWPAAGCGVGTCLSFRTSEPPNSPTRIAFIFGLQRCYPRLASYHMADAQRLRAPKQNPADMSALGRNRTFRESLTEVRLMSALPQKADTGFKAPCSLKHYARSFLRVAKRSLIVSLSPSPK